ncbi:hypothetical protein [Winogradskya humida]|uniref:Secreted protein with PEP-CTERM sorting signal n=1 Tax=Winogradskya humida TaxID=113566 RepID=A0ABQ3ZRF5_9ACTN|nr:hypothetical protein [Actinoplanes humidus]GIE21167.1 hypothetical protein Ahu01nite_042690 [Actinoplanes humidus]
MVFQYWHLGVVAAVAAVVVWGMLAARRATLIGLAATLVVISGWLLYTLVLDEPYIDHDAETVVMIGTPAVVGVVFGLLAVRNPWTRRQA